MANREKPWKAEYAKTGRSKCRTCNDFIGQDLLRLGRTIDAPRFDGRMTVWHHANCLLKKEGQIKSVGDVEGLDLLRWKDRQMIKSSINPRTNDAEKPDEQHENGHRFMSLSSLEERLKKQNEEVWHIKDELKKHVKTKELKEMLEANTQYAKGSENDLRECCADGMLFGALGKCPVCGSQSLRYVGEQYRCHGDVSEFTRCSYSTKNPERLGNKWRIPRRTNNEYLREWFNSQKAKKPIRVLPLPSAASEVYDEEDLQNLRVTVAGESMDEIDNLKKNLKAAGVKFYRKVKKDINCLVWLGKELDDNNSEIKTARRLKIPVVSLNYLENCLQKKKKLPFDLYSLKPASPYNKVAPILVPEPVVHEASGLQKTGHILKDGEHIYTTTLNKSDFSTGVNSYYILQIIQEDEDSNSYLFRKWGRIGHETIGGSKRSEKMPMSQAIKDFKRLFKKQTGNPWESWSPNRDNFKKIHGKYHPVNDDDVKLVPPVKLEETSQLHPQVKELMEWICKEQIDRANEMKRDINIDELPLGKPREIAIKKGLEILREIRDLLPRSDDQAISSIVDLSNKFYIVIPSVHPQPIFDKEDLDAKEKLLARLLKIEEDMEEKGISIEVDASPDENYRKLRCDIKPLPKDSDDYKLIQKYLLNTRHFSPAYGEWVDWVSELEEIFEIDREEEKEKYASYGGTLRNKILLWHGCRLRNILGILRQGLIIAHRAALTTDNWLGEGIYFADLVSSSAYYTHPKEGESRLLFLAEVALGNMHEVLTYQNIEKLPEGKHSVKGVGKFKPSEDGFVLWRDQVMVPCGEPIPTGIESESDRNEYYIEEPPEGIEYDVPKRPVRIPLNEYVVYNTAQAKLRFLVKVKF